jgi:hypothetical protein
LALNLISRHFTSADQRFINAAVWQREPFWSKAVAGVWREQRPLIPASGKFGRAHCAE